MRTKEVVFLSKDEVGRYEILQMVRAGKSVRYQLPGKDFMLIEQDYQDFMSVGSVTFVQVSFMGYRKEENTNQEYWINNQTEYFEPEQAVKAVDCFVTRMLSSQPQLSLGVGTTVEAIKVRKSGIVSLKNHYVYLDAVAPYFWPLVFNRTMEETHCGGIVTAHGDKCYSHRREWEAKGISFSRAALIFLLSYTAFFEGDDRSNIFQWVVDQYPQLLDKILEAEKQAEAKYRL